MTSKNRPESGRNPSSRRRSKRSKSRKRRDHGFREPGTRKIGVWVFVAITAIIVIAAVLYEFQSRQNESRIAKKDAINDANLLLSDEFVSIKQAYAKLATSSNESLPVQITNLAKRLKLAKEAMDIAESPEEVFWSRMAYLSAAVSTESTSVRNQLSRSNNFEPLREQAKAWEEDPNEIVAEEASLATLVLEIIDTLRTEDLDARKGEMKNQVDRVLKRYPESLKVAQSLKQLYTMFRLEQRFEPLEIELRQQTGNHFIQSNQAELHRIGHGYLTEALLLKHKIPTKEKAFIVNRLSAAQELADAIEQLINNESPSDFTLIRLVGSCNVMELYGHYDVAINTVNKLNEVADQLPESEFTRFRKVARNTITRCRAIGTPIQISEKAVDGTPINGADLPKKPTLLFFFPGQSDELADLIELVKDKEDTYGANVNIIMIAIEGNQEKLIELAKKNDIESELIIDTDMSSQLYQQFPVETRPSILIVDSQRIMNQKIIGIRDLDDALLKLLQSEGG